MVSGSVASTPRSHPATPSSARKKEQQAMADMESMRSWEAMPSGQQEKREGECPGGS